MPIDASAIALIAQILAPGGIAAIEVKAVLNGTKERVKTIHDSVEKIENKMDRLDEKFDLVDKRVVALEVERDLHR